MNRKHFLKYLEKKGMGSEALAMVAEAMVEYEAQKAPNSSWKMADVLRNEIGKQHEEGIWVLMLDIRLNPLGVVQVGMGDISETVFPKRRFARELVESGAPRFVLCHNHPSGDPSPSDDDFQLTTVVKDLGALLGADLVDHIILTDFDYYSFNDKGHL